MTSPRHAPILESHNPKPNQNKTWHVPEMREDVLTRTRRVLSENRGMHLKLRGSQGGSSLSHGGFSSFRIDSQHPRSRVGPTCPFPSRMLRGFLLWFFFLFNFWGWGGGWEKLASRMQSCSNFHFLHPQGPHRTVPTGTKGWGHLPGVPHPGHRGHGEQGHRGVEWGLLSISGRG